MGIEIRLRTRIARSFGSTLGTLVALGAILLAERSDACSRLPPPPTTISPLVPVEGALVLRIRCWAEECPDEIPLAVRDGLMETVPGQIVEAADIAAGLRYVAWKPDVPFGPDRTYSVEFNESIVVLDRDMSRPWLDFETTSAEPELPNLKVKSELSIRVKLTGEEVCCEIVRDDCGNYLPCSVITDGAVTEAVMTLSFEPPPGALAQYVYSARGTSPETGASPFDTSGQTGLIFQRAGAYCYEWVARHVVSGDETVVSSDCLDESGVTEPDVDAEIERGWGAVFAGCSVPPPGHEELWCEKMRSGELSCDDMPDGSRCRAMVAEECDSDEPTEDGEAEDGSEESPSRNVKGCACAHAGATPGSRGAMGLLLFGAAAWFRSLRRRGQAKARPGSA